MQRCAEELWHALHNGHLAARMLRALLNALLYLTGLPLFLCIVCTAAVCPLYSLQLLMIFLFTGSYVLLMALVGLFLGVKMPTLTWTNEIMPIKQGAPVVITLFGGFGYMVLLVCWIYASARMDVRILRGYELFCDCKCVSICGCEKKVLNVFRGCKSKTIKNVNVFGR